MEAIILVAVVTLVPSRHHPCRSCLSFQRQLSRIILYPPCSPLNRALFACQARGLGAIRNGVRVCTIPITWIHITDYLFGLSLHHQHRWCIVHSVAWCDVENETMQASTFYIGVADASGCVSWVCKQNGERRRWKWLRAAQRHCESIRNMIGQGRVYERQPIVNGIRQDRLVWTVAL